MDRILKITIRVFISTSVKICLSLILVLLQSGNLVYGQIISYKLYPQLYDTVPKIKSPYIIHDTLETMLVLTKNNQYGVVPVTVEKGAPLLYSYKLGTHMGKDNQLLINSGDFPSLTNNGLHSEEQLDKKEMITGIPINIINCTAKPNAYSYSGFIADDEDIISVLKGDNRLVKKMELTHRDLAKPLFHVWNLILKETELGNWARFYDNIQKVYYNGNELNFSASGSKGWQPSIFNDEIQGRYNIHVDRNFTIQEDEYLKEKYGQLSDNEMDELKHKLSHLDFSEMLPYYIMQYGFYEGHTDYRCDPVAIAFIFGLKNIEEIDNELEGRLFNILTDHYILKKN
jgi:hypothetical protein